jgi:site-specific DNA recombinase
MKAAIYCRVSTEDQADAKTIQNQVNFAQDYCRLHEIDIYDFYLDDGVTGSIALEMRPQGRRLLGDAQQGKFDAVLVYRLDRMARSTRHLLNAYHLLKEFDVAFRSMTEPFDTTTGIGTFVMTLLASIAALERDTIAERTALGRDRAAKDGKWLGGKPPYGYRVNDEGHLEIEPHEAEVVRLIYEMYAQGPKGVTPISDYLNATKVPPAVQARGINVQTLGRWHGGSVLAILRNPTYRGTHLYQKESKAGKKAIARSVPAIVSEELWAAAEEMRKRNLIEATRNARRSYLLRSLIKCGTCGGNFVGCRHMAFGKEYVYYVCTGNSHRRMGGRGMPKCHVPSIRAEAIEHLVWEDVKRFAENPNPVIAELQDKIRKRTEHEFPAESRLKEIERALDEKQRERERVIGLFRQSLISETEVGHELSALSREMEVLVSEKDTLTSRRTNEAALRARAGSVRTTLERLRVLVQEPSEATRRELVQSLVEGIEVVPVMRGTKRMPQITIRYCFDLGTPSEPPREAAVRTPVEQTDLSICNRRGSPFWPRSIGTGRRNSRLSGTSCEATSFS